MFGGGLWYTININASFVFNCVYVEEVFLVEKSAVFNTELNYISDDKIRESAKYLLERLPDYFYVMPASTSGMHHPEFSLGEGGLVRHTKVAVRIAMELFRDNIFNTFEFPEHTQDLIIMALLLHDGFKQGKEPSGHTAFDHPLIAAEFVFDNIRKLSMDQLDALQVPRLIASHMGPWCKDKEGKIILPVPQKDDEIFVHECDYLASRNFLNVAFEDNEIVDSANRELVKLLQK